MMETDDMTLEEREEFWAMAVEDFKGSGLAKYAGARGAGHRGIPGNDSPLAGHVTGKVKSREKAKKVAVIEEERFLPDDRKFFDRLLSQSSRFGEPFLHSLYAGINYSGNLICR